MQVAPLATLPDEPVDFDFASAATPDGALDGEQQAVEASPYATVCNMWNRRVGRELAESPVNQAMTNNVRRGFKSSYDEDDHDQRPTVIANPKATDLNDFELTDAFTVVFEPAIELEASASPAATAWFLDFMACDESRKLRRSTLMDHDLSELAAWQIARQYHEYIAKASEDAGTEDESIVEGGKRARSVREAARDAASDVETMECVQAGMNQGEGMAISRKELAQAFHRAKQSSRLMGILKSAGRMMQYAKARRKERIPGVDDVSGVTMGGDISSILASEFMLLGDDILELDLMWRIVNRQVLQLERTREVRVGRGPVVVVLDESGSMQGENIIDAKAFALTMAWLAKVDQRWISLVGFSSSGQTNYLTMPPESWCQASLLDWMDHFYGGGTDFGVLGEVSRRWQQMGCPEGKTDVIFITDAQAEFGAPLVRDFNAWKQANSVQCYGISVAAGVGAMPSVCDHSTSINRFSMAEGTVRELLASIGG